MTRYARPIWGSSLTQGFDRERSAKIVATMVPGEESTVEEE